MRKRKCDVEVFARVTGFFRPVQSWNKGKTEEFKHRKNYNIETEAVEHDNEDSRVAEALTG